MATTNPSAMVSSTTDSFNRILMMLNYIMIKGKGQLYILSLFSMIYLKLLDFSVINYKLIYIKELNMKKILMILLLLIMPVLIFAFDPSWLNNIVFFNGTSNDIEYIFLSPGDSEYWGPEILNSERVLESRSDLGFYIFYPDECNDFDILAIDSNGDSLTIFDYTICDGVEETIAFSKRDMSEEEPYFEFVTLDIYNDIETEIYYIFVSPADSNMYGVDLLDEVTTILPGDYLSLLIPIGEGDVDYDVMAVDEYNDTYSFSYTISLDYGTEQEVLIEMGDMD